MFTKRERRRLRQALRRAIDYQESLIDAHRVTYTIPESFTKGSLSNIRDWERDIKAFRRLRDKLK